MESILMIAMTESVTCEVELPSYKGPIYLYIRILDLQHRHLQGHTYVP